METYIRPKDRIYSKSCIDCNEEFNISYTNYITSTTRGWYRCWKCSYKLRGANKAKQYQNLPQEEKDRLANELKERNIRYYESLPPEEKAKKQERMRQIRNEYINSLTEEGFNQLKEKRREGVKDYFANLTQEEYEKKAETARQNVSHAHAAFDDTKRQNLATKALKRYISLSPEEKEAKMQAIWKGNERWRSSMSTNERRALSDRLSQAGITRYNNYSIEQRMQLREKQLKPVQGNLPNKLNERFIKAFNESYISNDYYCKAEIITESENVIHSWDYGIYNLSNDILKMVVDLDGRFFHGDINDYNGQHSREEHDEKRFMSVPPNVIYHIIYEIHFYKSFESMIRLLMNDYNGFVKEQFKLCRMMPFPQPTYDTNELIKSWRQLQKLNINVENISYNNREGDRIINHFHHSIYQAKCKGSRLSPYDAWYDDRLLKNVIQNRIIYVNTINPNKILQGFNIARVAKKVSVFSAGRAKLLIHKYLSEYNEVFDPFSGFSGRLLGTVSLDKKYIGQDISGFHVDESKQIINFFKFYDVATVTISNCITSKGSYQCLFTCPPYSDSEQWYGVPVDNRSCDDWIDICLANFKCEKYLFVVDITTKYQNNIVDTIINKSHFGITKEYVVLIQSEL